MGEPLDQLDVTLLKILQSNNQLTADALADQVGLSPSAIARRIRRLRGSGVIAADTSIVSETAVGQPLTAVVNVQLERHARGETEQFKRLLKASENVQFCLEISGTFDLLLLVVVPDMDKFNTFADELFGEQRAVRRYETSFVKRRLKATLALPIEQFVHAGEAS